VLEETSLFHVNGDIKPVLDVINIKPDISYIEIKVKITNINGFCIIGLMKGQFSVEQKPNIISIRRAEFAHNVKLDFHFMKFMKENEE